MQCQKQVIYLKKKEQKEGGKGGRMGGREREGRSKEDGYPHSGEIYDLLKKKLI